MAPISFARGAPAPSCLDPALISDCARTALERDGTTILSYGTGGGYGPLRELLAERHGVDPGRVFVTTGGLQGFVFYSAAQLARRPGRVLVEAPTYDRPLKVLRWHGVEVVAIPMDEEGLDPDALEAELRRPGDISFLYTIPTFQNPSGRTLGEERRRRIAELAASFDLDVLEDDPYGLVRYEGVAPAGLHTLEGGERVTFTSSFSKTVAPGLRVGWFVVPEGLRPPSTIVPSRPTSPRRCSPRRSCTSCSRAARSSRTSSASAGSFAPSATRCSPRSTAGSRGARPGAAPRAATSCGSTSPRHRGRRVPDRATEAGVTFVRGSDFFPAEGGESSARLAFSYESPERIVEGVGLLAGLL